MLFDPAIQKVGNETANVAQDIIERVSEMRAREHDIVVWQVRCVLEGPGSHNAKGFAKTTIHSEKFTRPRNSSRNSKTRLMCCCRARARSRRSKRSVSRAYISPINGMPRVPQAVVCQRDALLHVDILSEKEYNALGMILSDLDLKRGRVV